MLRSSSFNVFLPPTDLFPVRIYNTAVRRSYQFTLSWDEMLLAAKLDKGVANKLLSYGLLTQTRSYLEELEEYYNWRTFWERKSLDICYTVTTECSLKCNYCFQKNLSREKTTSEAITQFSSLLSNHLYKNKSIKNIQLVLFGGDPILEYELSLETLTKISEVCRQFSVCLNSLMTTNGIIADLNELKALRDAGLTTTMISFDGGKDEHDRHRNGTFDSLLKNLPIFAKHFCLILKYNIRKGNSSVDEYMDFIRHVEKAVPKKDFVIALEAIHPVVNAGKSRGIFDINSIELARQMLKLYDATIKRGLRCDMGNALHPPCPYTQGNSIIVQPNGTFLCCGSGFDIPEFVIGNLNEIQELPVERSDFRNYVITTAAGFCSESSCSLFPLCETGCPYEKHRLGLSPSEILCRRTFIEEFIPHLFQLGLDRQNKKN